MSLLITVRDRKFCRRVWWEVLLPIAHEVLILDDVRDVIESKIHKPWLVLSSKLALQFCDVFLGVWTNFENLDVEGDIVSG